MSSSPRQSFLLGLTEFLQTRLEDPPPGSYSHELMTDHELSQRKIMEEAFEVCLELGRPDLDPGRLADESADLVFHLLCGLVGAGLTWSDVENVLVSRHGTVR